LQENNIVLAGVIPRQKNDTDDWTCDKVVCAKKNMTHGTITFSRKW